MTICHGDKAMPKKGHSYTATKQCQMRDNVPQQQSNARALTMFRGDNVPDRESNAKVVKMFVVTMFQIDKAMLK